MAPWALRWGIGTRNEFSAGLYHLDVDGRSNFNHPWFIRDGRIASIDVFLALLEPDRLFASFGLPPRLDP